MTETATVCPDCGDQERTAQVACDTGRPSDERHRLDFTFQPSPCGLDRSVVTYPCSRPDHPCDGSPSQLELPQVAPGPNENAVAHYLTRSPGCGQQFL